MAKTLYCTAAHLHQTLLDSKPSPHARLQLSLCRHFGKGGNNRSVLSVPLSVYALVRYRSFCVFHHFLYLCFHLSICLSACIFPSVPLTLSHLSSVCQFLSGLGVCLENGRSRVRILLVPRFFRGQVILVTSKLALQWLPCQAPGVIGSVLGLVGPVSVYCDWVRWKVWSATSISVWQRVKLSEHIRP